MCLNPNQYAASGNCFVFFVVVFSPPSTAQEKKKKTVISSGIMHLCETQTLSQKH